MEDAVSGVASGKAAGMKVLAVLITTPRTALQAVDPDWIVPDLSQCAFRLCVIVGAHLTCDSVSVEWKGDKILVTIRE